MSVVIKANAAAGALTCLICAFLSMPAEVTLTEACLAVAVFVALGALIGSAVGLIFEGLFKLFR